MARRARDGVHLRARLGVAFVLGNQRAHRGDALLLLLTALAQLTPVFFHERINGFALVALHGQHCGGLDVLALDLARVHALGKCQRPVAAAAQNILCTIAFALWHLGIAREQRSAHAGILEALHRCHQLNAAAAVCGGLEFVQQQLECIGTAAFGEQLGQRAPVTGGSLRVFHKRYGLRHCFR